MSIAVRRGIYGCLSRDSTLTATLAGGSAGIFHAIAPEGAGYPFVIFQKASGVPRQTMRALPAFDEEIWTVKGVDRNSTADRVDGIASRIDVLLTDGTVTISGGTLLFCRRESDVEYTEIVDGETVRHTGANFRLIYER